MIEDLEIPSSDGTVKFVDDTTAYEIIPKGKTSSAQKLVDEVTTWSSTNKFQLHPKKCKEMRISFSRLLPKYDNLLIDTDTIQIVDSFKLLGMTINKDLKWNTHIDLLIKKASKRLYFISHLKRANMPPEDLTKFYVACIRSILLYACQVYHYSLPDYLNKSLERIQKRVMKIIYGHDISYESALDQAGLNKLSEYRQHLCDKFFNKTITNPEDRLQDLLPHNDHQLDYLRNTRPLTIPICKTNRFKNSFLISSSLRYNKNILI